MSSSEAKLSPTGQDNGNEGSVGAADKKKKEKKERKEKSIWRCFSQEADPTLEEEDSIGSAQDGWLLPSKEATFEGEPSGSRATLG